MIPEDTTFRPRQMKWFAGRAVLAPNVRSGSRPRSLRKDANSFTVAQPLWEMTGGLLAMDIRTGDHELLRLFEVRDVPGAFDFHKLPICKFVDGGAAERGQLPSDLISSGFA